MTDRDNRSTLIGPPKLDFTSLRAGDVVNFSGAFYDVTRLAVEEQLDYRDEMTGQPRYGPTKIVFDLRRAHWLGLDDVPMTIKHQPPADALTIGIQPGDLRTKINGLGYFVEALQMTTSTAAPKLPPEWIKLELTRDPRSDVA